MKAALPETETERLAALWACRVLDTAPEERFDGLTRLAALACGTPFAAISLVDESRQWFKSITGLDLRETPRDIAFCAHTILQPDVMVVRDTARDRRFADNPLVTGEPRIRFYAGAPLVTDDGHALGDLCVADRVPRRLAPAQKDALRTLARHVSGHLERGRVGARERRGGRKGAVAQLAREREVTAALQRSLLRMPPMDRFAGLDVSSLYAPATTGLEVGGDFLDAFGLAGGQVALVVGDVAGKGLEAAARTTEAKYVLRAFLSESRRPADALTRLNRYLWAAQEHDGDQAPQGRGVPDIFICLSLAVVDTARGEAWFSAAGAEPPLIVRASGEAEGVSVTGLPLRVHSNTEYVERHSPFSAGDLLVMVTDGITEARSGHAFLGYEGLTDLAARSYRMPSTDRIAQVIADGARDFAGGRQQDDVALLVARRR